MTRIACVGITVLDRIWYLDELPKEGGKFVAKSYTEVGGDLQQQRRSPPLSWGYKLTLSDG